MEYPWYTIVDASQDILQGDFVLGCPLISPPKVISKERSVPAEVIEYDVIVMSQSCDLVEKKVDLVLVCPFWSIIKLEEMSDFWRSHNGKEALRKGNVPGLHLLNKCDLPQFQNDYSIVDFRRVFSIPFEFLREFVNSMGPRRRLLPPYREHLSQAFARFFMRVGLPIDIPPFKAKKT